MLSKHEGVMAGDPCEALGQLVVEDDIEEGAVDMQLAIVIDEA